MFFNPVTKKGKLLAGWWSERGTLPPTMVGALENSKLTGPGLVV